MKGLAKAPVYCEHCGRRLSPASHGYAQGFDTYTGTRKPDRIWISLDCPKEHEQWRRLGVRTDALSPLWYRTV